jgi:hypothetical protein
VFRHQTSSSHRLHDTENGESTALLGHGEGVAAIISPKGHSTFNTKTAFPAFFRRQFFPAVAAARKIVRPNGKRMAWHMTSTDPTEPKLLAVCYRYAAMAVELHALTLRLRLKAGFRPEQPRIPAGNPDGGQWAGEGSGNQPIVVSRRGPRGGGQVRILGRWQAVTPGQEARLAVSTGRMQEALRAVRRREPNWKPTPQAYETVEGLIRANEAIAQEAMLRALQLRLPRTGIWPYAKEWIVAPRTNRRLNRAEQAEIDRIGRTYGCHRCGITTAGTKRGHFIGDHQVPKSVGRPSRIYPHCSWCSKSQGGLISKGRR